MTGLHHLIDKRGLSPAAWYTLETLVCRHFRLARAFVPPANDRGC